MKVLGIDPGTTRVGYGILNLKGKRTNFLDCGCFEFDHKETDERPHEIYVAIANLVKKIRPDIVAVEKVFFSKNKKTAIAVSEARGAIMAAVRGQGVFLRSYTPTEVKRAISTHGQTDKRGVGKMVGLLLGLKEIPKPDDAVDALAIALCCAHDTRVSKVIDNKIE